VSAHAEHSAIRHPQASRLHGGLALEEAEGVEEGETVTSWTKRPA
jgi:hypothetical protein